MCGRFCFFHKEKEIKEHYGIDVPSLFTPTYNASPSQFLPVIPNTKPLTIDFYKWGLIPSWSKNISIGNKMINARLESLKEKSSFRNLFGKNHCLIPVSGFYEWKKVGKGKQPYLITCSEVLFSLAGLWDSWYDSLSGQEVRSFTIITTAANDTMKDIHHRMPLVIKKDQEKAWLNCLILHDELLSITDSCQLSAYPVSQEINKPSNNSPNLILPLDEPTLF